MQDKWEPTLIVQRENALHSDAPLELVFLPGLLCDERLWEGQIMALSDIAHSTVVRLDTTDSMEAMAAEVLHQAPDGPFMLAGMSMGGYVAFEIMRRTPQHVLGLALISTSARPDTPAATETRRTQMKLAEHDMDGVIDQLLPKLVHESRLNDDSTAGLMRSMAKQLGAEVFKRQQEAIITRPDSRSILCEIKCPTLILCGRDDLITPPEVHDEIDQGIPNAHLGIIEHCGHLVPLEQPEQVTRELRNWLTEVRSTKASP
ncbi:MAG TPA: alpha/beta hydrolase [Rhodocyclaceae bacterium]|jgi:pimeloyl-ACP methyl ester carboxylesterase|nr:alpha/beta hydrolase [Rhodocyclaceae bacterium]